MNKKETIQKIKKGAKNEMTWANLVTLFRLGLIVASLIFLKDYKIWLAVVVIIGISLDGVDGFVARKYGGSYLGAMVDIAGDRIVELCILFFYAKWGIIPYVFPLVFLVRGMATDFLRLLNMIYPSAEFEHPLSMGNAINRFVRGFYAVLKALAFSVILIYPEVGFWLMVLALAMNLWRGIPAIFNSRSKELMKKFFESFHKQRKKPL